MSNKNQNNGSNVNNNVNANDKPANKPKVKFSVAHPVATRRIKKGLELVAGIGTVFGSVLAANALADRKRTYYTIDLAPRLDGSVHMDDINPDVLDLNKTAVFDDGTV